MDKDQISPFDIRYVKLHFTVEFTEEADVPVYKMSALRGGMGEMLLRANCIRDRDCDGCDFESECIVRRTMYSKMEIQPSFMTAGDSVGYVIECEDYREHVRAGDRMQFNMLLFGKTIVYFSQFLNSFYALGMNGLGKEKARFAIVSVTNTTAVPILNGGDVFMANLQVQYVSDYIAYRKKQLCPDTSSDICLSFKSPLTVKFRGEELREFVFEAILESACRRIYMLDCFEGIESWIHDKEYIDSVSVPQTSYEEHKSVSVRRYSERKNNAMYLRGIEGKLILSGVSEELLDILLAGELIHVGKNTSFGFGRYRITKEGDS